MLEFENTIHRIIQEVSDIILRTDRLGKENLSSKDLPEHKQASRKLSVTRRSAYNFLTTLDTMTAEEKQEDLHFMIIFMQVGLT